MPAAILHLLPTAQLEGTAPARIVASLASGLDREKYHVHAWFFGTPGPLLDDVRAAGATVRSINWLTGVRDPIGAYHFWRSIRNSSFQIVHQHCGGRAVCGLIRHFSDARLVGHLHYLPKSGSVREVPGAIRGADLIITVSRALARQIPNLSPIVVHAGVKLSKQSDDAIVPARPTVTIGAASRLVDLKAISDLLRAVALLATEFPHVRLEIAGEGPERQDLETEAHRLGLMSRVRFLGWQRDLATILRSWDIFAMPSRQEGLPMAALEAMAEGLPVVASSVGGLLELVEDGETGWLVPASDPAALSAKLRLLIIDPKRRRNMGVAGRERVRKHFSIDRMVSEIEGIYGSLLHSPLERTHK